MDLLTLILGGTATGSIITAVSLITRVVANKKLRTPGDRHAEVTTVLEFFKEGIADSRADRMALEETTKDLREYIAELEGKSREAFNLRVKLEERIAELESRIKEKERRILYLEMELRRYISINATELGDIEDTAYPE